MEEAKPLDPKRDLWELQPNETDKAIRAFKIYLALGTDRSIQKVADELQCSFNNVRKWYERWSWKERAAAYEANLIDTELKKMEKGRLAMKKRHLNLSQALQGISSVQIRAWQEQAQLAEELRQAGDENWKSHLPALSPGDIMKLAEIGMKNERLVYGEPTEATETTVIKKQKSLKEDIEEYMHLFGGDDGE